MKKTFDPSQPLHPDATQIQLSLQGLLPANHIVLDLGAQKRHEALAKMVTLAQSQGSITDRDSLLIALAERELKG